MFIVTKSGELINLLQLHQIYIENESDYDYHNVWGESVVGIFLLFSGDGESCNRYQSILYTKLEKIGLTISF